MNLTARSRPFGPKRRHRATTGRHRVSNRRPSPLVEVDRLSDVKLPKAMTAWLSGPCAHRPLAPTLDLRIELLSRLWGNVLITVARRLMEPDGHNGCPTRDVRQNGLLRAHHRRDMALWKEDLSSWR